MTDRLTIQPPRCPSTRERKLINITNLIAQSGHWTYMDTLEDLKYIYDSDLDELYAGFVRLYGLPAV